MQIKTAMLMAAGMGTRMRPLTNTCPKPMIEVAGRSLINRTLDRLVEAGVERAIVNVHYLADMMETHVKQRRDIEIIVSDERDMLLETGGGVVKALPHLGADPVYILNTDTCWADDANTVLPELAAAFDPTSMDSLLLLARIENSMGYDGQGDFSLDDAKRLVRRGDRPSAPYVFAGVYVLNPQIITGYAVDKFSANIYWNKSLEQGRLFGHVMTPYWMHVGDPDARDKAEAYIWGQQHSCKPSLLQRFLPFLRRDF